MKITMYELLGLVKDDKAPKKIKYDGQEYKITKILLEDSTCYVNYINEDMEYIFPINTNHLNDEVEILEEEKKIPGKIKDKYCSQISKVELAQKYNEIIDYLDYLKSKGE